MYFELIIDTKSKICISVKSNKPLKGDFIALIFNSNFLFITASFEYTNKINFSLTILTTENSFGYSKAKEIDNAKLIACKI